MRVGFGLGRLRKSNSTFSVVYRSNFIPYVEYNSQTILFAYIILINCWELHVTTRYFISGELGASKCCVNHSPFGADRFSKIY